jgi:hypothetical protein
MAFFWDIAPFSVTGVHRRFTRAYCVHNHGEPTRHYIPEDSHLHTRRLENLKSHYILDV